MTFNVSDIAYIVANLFTLYIIKRFMNIFFLLSDKKRKFAFLAYMSYFVITSAIHFFSGITGLMLVGNIVLLFFISYFYDADWKKRSIAVAYIYFAGFASEVVFSASTLITNFNLLSRYKYTSVIGYTVCKILLYFIVMMTENIVNLKKYKILPLWLFASSVFIPIVTITLEIFFIISDIQSQAVIIASMIILFGINIITFLLYDSISAAYDKQLKTTMYEKERDYFYNQCVLMEKSAEEIRSFRHDINNHIAILQKLIDSQQTEKASEYINQLYKTQSKLSKPISSTGNIVVDSILNHKLGSVNNEKIKTTLKASIPTELSVDIMDISVILTNLLDNAVYAVEKIENGGIINIDLTYRKGVFIVKIKNSFQGEVHYENGEIQTTKTDSEKHGMGIKNVRNVVEKYNGTLEISHDDDFFMVKTLVFTP